MRYTLVALKLPVNAERVVHLSVELEFVTLSSNLARTARFPSTTGHSSTVGKFNSVANLFIKQKTLIYNLWLAVNFEDFIKLQQN